MKRGPWVLLTLFALAILVIAAYVVGSSVTEQRRAVVNQALARRVEEAKAQVHTRQEALRAARPTPEAPPLTEDELSGLIQSLEAAMKDGWDELHEEIENTTGPWPSELLAKVDDWLEAHHELLAHAQALAHRGADVDIELTAEAVSANEIADAAVDFSDIANLRSAVRLLNLAAQRDAEQGSVDDALTLFLDAFAVSDEMGKHSAIITQLTRIAGYNATLDASARILAQHTLNAAQLDQLDRALVDAYQRDQFAAAIANEAQLGIVTFDQTRDSPIGAVLRPFINMNETSYTEGMAAIADVAAMPYHEAYPLIADVQQQSQDLPFTHYISRTLLSMIQPALLRAIETQAAHEAAIDMARIAIALERVHQSTGAYPESLGAIAPHVNGPLPIDPFTGQPYGYRPQGDTFTLYSVGSDLTDDNGIPGRRGGDIVWNAPPLPAERP